MDDKMTIDKMTTEELKEALESAKKSSSFDDETWDLIFAIERELRNRGALPVITYDHDR